MIAYMITRVFNEKKEGFKMDVTSTRDEIDRMHRVRLTHQPTNHELAAYYNALVTLGLIKGDLLPVREIDGNDFNYGHMFIENVNRLTDTQFVCDGTFDIMRKTKIGKDIVQNVMGFPSFLSWAKSTQLARKLAPSMGEPTRAGAAGFGVSASDGYEMLFQMIRLEGDQGRIVFGPKDGIRPEVKGTLRWDRRTKTETPEWMNQESLASIYTSVRAMIETMRERYTTELNRLQADRERAEERAKRAAITTIMTNMAQLKAHPDWELTMSDGEMYAEYSKPIQCTHIAITKGYLLGDGSTQLATLQLPKEVAEKLILSKVRVNIMGNGIGGGQAIGRHPHLSGSIGGRSWGSLCVGDFRGKPISALSELVEGLKTAYAHSMYDSGDVRGFVEKVRRDPDIKKLFEAKPKEAAPKAACTRSGKATRATRTRRSASDEAPDERLPDEDESEVQSIYDGDVFTV